MAFIVKKTIHGKEYYYLNENKRVDGKVKTKTIAYLGKVKKEAEKKAKEILEDYTNPPPTHPKNEQTKMVKKEISIEELANFCKAKGFVFPSSEIYGGFSGFWDFGPLGVELFKNIKEDWWNHFVYQKTNMVGIDASVISHPRTWKASGHLDSFKDIAVICKKCKKSAKIDASEWPSASDVSGETSEEGKVKCECGGDFEKQGEFNLLFKTNVGALRPEEAYLRGETAQGMFMNFKLISQTSRMQLPFGIAQIGSCFRNEIAPRDFLFRSREFHIGEFEFFIAPNEMKCELLDKKYLNVKFRFLDEETQLKRKENLKEVLISDLLKVGKIGEWHAYWLAEQINWFRSLGLDEIKIREHTKEELSHYSSATFDVDYEYPFGSKEVAGNANRGQFDLTQHQKESGKSMEIFDEKSGEKVLPRVIEPTFGMERIFLAILTKAYCEDSFSGNVVLKIPPHLSPIKVAIFPIVKQPEYEKIATTIANDLGEEFNVIYDKSGSIGRRYARQDEIGTPFCVTIDEDSLKKQDVTIRDRDTSEQIKVKIKDLKEVLKQGVQGKNILELGKLVQTRKK